MVRAVQGADAAARKGCCRLCRQGCGAGQDRHRQESVHRRAIPDQVDPDRLCHVPGAIGRGPDTRAQRDAVAHHARPDLEAAADRKHRGKPGSRTRTADRDGRAGIGRGRCRACRQRIHTARRNGPRASGRSFGNGARAGCRQADRCRRSGDRGVARRDSKAPNSK